MNRDCCVRHGRLTWGVWGTKFIFYRDFLTYIYELNEQYILIDVIHNE